jgi:hypothetical protein
MGSLGGARGGPGCSPAHFGCFTGSVNDLPRVPTDPLDLQDLVAGLSPEELIALVQQIDSSAAARALGQFGAFGPRNREIDLAPPPDEPSLLTLTIDLRGTEPRIWRRLSLPGDLTLDAVHTLLQAAMGWTDSHLHRFEPGVGDRAEQPYFITEFDEQEGDEGTREESVRLDQVLRAPGDRLTYRYDFGDGWEHLVTLESLAPLAPDNREPSCLAGAGACPPEDAGGIGGHHEIAAWLRAGAPADRVPEPFEDAQEAHDWLPPDYDPDEFDAVAATAAMLVWARGEHLPWHALPEPLGDLLRELRGAGWLAADTWLMALGPRVAVELDEDDVRRAARPWLAVLDAVGPGTKLTAAGYLPPAMVERIGQASGVTDSWIGKANREDLTWPVAELRANAQEVGLLRKAKGTLTPTARARAAAGHPRQLVATVLDRLPLGKGFSAEAGWFALLGSAAGESGEALDARVALMMADRGWRTQDGSGISPARAHGGAQRTLDALESMAGGEAPDPGLLTQLARAALFGVAEPA